MVNVAHRLSEVFRSLSLPYDFIERLDVRWRLPLSVIIAIIDGPEPGNAVQQNAGARVMAIKRLARYFATALSSTIPRKDIKR